MSNKTGPKKKIYIKTKEEDIIAHSRSSNWMATIVAHGLASNRIAIIIAHGLSSNRIAIARIEPNPN